MVSDWLSSGCCRIDPSSPDTTNHLYSQGYGEIPSCLFKKGGEAHTKYCGGWLCSRRILERETIFIIGTPEGAGRVSSHPPRNLHSSTNTPSPPQAGPSSSTPSVITPIRPLQCAWNDLIAVTKSGRTHQLRISALHTCLDLVIKYQTESGKGEKLSLPEYTPAQMQPQYGNSDFVVRSQCLAHVSSSQEGMLLFIFEHNTSLGQWSSPNNVVQQLGPSHFATFPAHHFFARVYRPAAIASALLNRQPTFCAEAAWIHAPWQHHPKAPFDNLCDILAQIPNLIARIDEIFSPNSTVPLSLAQSALEDCLGLQATLENWHTSLHQFNYASQPAYWISRNQSGAQVPFSDILSFCDPLAALTFTWYWTAKVLLYPYLELLSHTIFPPAVDGDNSNAQQQQQQDLFPAHPYSSDQVRVIASNICRGLDAALATTAQPDLLALPVHAVESFYGNLNAVAAQTGDGALELMWLAGFRTRMAARGRRLAAGVMGRTWKDIAEW